MEPSILARINSPNDLRPLSGEELARLAEEIRDFIVRTTSCTGGHLASSLGAVELAISVHRALDTPVDKVVWDVGHQAYAHKLITGRRDRFETLRQKGGLSGFPRREESEYDVVDSGHAGSSISYGLGLALARDLRGDDYAVAAVIGDGSMTSGVAYEAMNQAGDHLSSNLIIILNDNEMSISRNTGGIASYLSRLRIKPGYTHLRDELEEIIRTMPGLGDGLYRVATHLKEGMTHAVVPGMLFEAFGLKYVGPIDGHDMGKMEQTIREAREIQGPVLIHVVTRKGRGYGHSERRPEKFHGIGSFDVETGSVNKRAGAPSYTEVFSGAAVRAAAEDPSVVAVTAAMKLGTGLEAFSRRFPRRFFDVGIAEQFAVNFAAGLALGGLKPVVAIYSTFLQRAFDQISQEVCLQNLPVVFAVDRAGIVGEDGCTHHGYFDVSYLRMLPGMTVMAPGDATELEPMLRFALSLGSPAAVRFPRSEAPEIEGVGDSPIENGRGELVRAGDDAVIFALGNMVKVAMEAAVLLEERGVSASVVNGRFAKPVDAGFVEEAARGKLLAMTLEDNAVSGGYGSGIAEAMEERLPGMRLAVRGLPDEYVQHGKTDELLEEAGLSSRAVAAEIETLLGRDEEKA